MVLGLGKMNMHPWEFKKYTWREFVLKLEGFNSVQLDQWHQTRALGFIYAKYSAPGLKNKNLRIEQFWPMGGDKKGKKRLSDLKGDAKMDAYNALIERLIEEGHLRKN